MNSRSLIRSQVGRLSRQLGLRSQVGKLARWLGLASRENPRGTGPISPDAKYAGGKLGDASDLLLPDFGGEFQAHFPGGAANLLSPRKLWELSWLAQQFDDLKLGGGDFLGLGVGREPLIYHLAHCARSVVATDLYSTTTAWSEARVATESVCEASPFPYPRERLSVRNMDMRRLECPADSFDAVWSCSSVEHVQTLPQLVQIFREAHRVLKPGGVALFTTEFSLGDPYLLPGVLSLWKDSTLFGGELRGLTLEGPVDLRYRGDVPGNHSLPRRSAHRLKLLGDTTGGSVGLCIHVGYTRLIPVAMAFRKTGRAFDWPEYLGAPAWYVSFAEGLEAFESKHPAAAASLYRRALNAADTPGARLHCYRSLVEAHVHAGQPAELHATLAEVREALPGLPDDDDALDLIGFVAAGAGLLPMARRCWERACDCPSTLPGSRLRIRINQLEAELAAEGLTAEARHLAHLAEAARCEALDFLGEGDLLLNKLDARYQALRRQHGLAFTAVAPGIANGGASPRLPQPGSQ